jgi:hypothetical protein
MGKSWCEFIIGLVILVFALWQTTYSKWIVVLGAIVLMLHSCMCKSCFACETTTSMASSKSAKGRKK